MEVILTRAEFFTLMALARAEAVIGVDPAEILPPDPQQRQAMYDEGERSLARRGLLRVNAAQEVELEQSLLRLVSIVTRPTHAVVTIKVTPGLGGQLFLHYGVDDYYVEQTLPTDSTHRLIDVGDGAALCRQLQAIFPLAATSAPAVSFQADAVALIDAYRVASEQGEAEARAVLTGLDPADAGTANRFLAATAAQRFSGTIDFFQIRPGETNEASECAVISGPGENWLIVPGEGTNARAGTVTPADFDQLLKSILT